ncbi:MAG: hypothetical protein HY459_04160 [Parcubacteria group bacterium]|nr:hypothetical protein [Parcubacteria group bacterium]
MDKLFPTYEIGSLPKLTAREKARKGIPIADDDISEVTDLGRRFSVDTEHVVAFLKKLQQENKLDAANRKALVDFNALLYIKLQEAAGLDVVYDGEARRAEMYQHVALHVNGFEMAPEMIRSRGPDSWRMAVCVAPPGLKEGSLDALVRNEFRFVQQHAARPTKIPVDDPYMIAVMSDNRHYLEMLGPRYQDDPHRLRYEAKRACTLALARNVIRPQVEAVVNEGARWIQLDIPGATVDIEHIPIMVEGINAVVDGIEGVKFSLHICYPRRVSLTEKSGYELLFPSILDLHPNVNHISLELSNADQYETDLAVFARHREQRQFELGVGVIDITLERQQREVMETPEIVRDRILTAARVLGDPKLVYVAPDCGMRQLAIERCVRLYETMVEGATLARKG